MSSSSTPISNSGDEDNAEQAVYSSFAAHEVIVIINGGSMGLLQVTAQSRNAAYHRATLLSFYFFILIYAVLRVSEVTLRRNQAPFHHFVGYISHLFGVLAALMLISIVSPIFTLIVAPLWLVWFFVVMYFFLAKLIRGEINHPRNEVHSDQISQV